MIFIYLYFFFLQRSQPTSQGQETSKPISSVSKQSSTDNHSTIVHHKPEGMFNHN